MKQAYDSRLPHLILRERIVVVSPKSNKHGTILSLQKRLGQTSGVSTANLYHTHPGWSALERQLETFVDITKGLERLPDISHDGNLVIETDPDTNALTLRLPDTNYVMQEDEPLARDLHLLERDTLTLLQIELVTLNRSFEALQQDPFYARTSVLEMVCSIRPRMDQGGESWRKIIRKAIGSGLWLSPEELKENHSDFRKRFNFLSKNIEALPINKSMEAVFNPYRKTQFIQLKLENHPDLLVKIELVADDLSLVKVTEIRGRKHENIRQVSVDLVFRDLADTYL